MTTITNTTIAPTDVSDTERLAQLAGASVSDRLAALQSIAGKVDTIAGDAIVRLAALYDAGGRTLIRMYVEACEAAGAKPVDSPRWADINKRLLETKGIPTRTVKGKTTLALGVSESFLVKCHGFASSDALSLIPAHRAACQSAKVRASVGTSDESQARYYSPDSARSLLAWAQAKRDGRIRKDGSVLAGSNAKRTKVEQRQVDQAERQAADDAERKAMADGEALFPGFTASSLSSLSDETLTRLATWSRLIVADRKAAAAAAKKGKGKGTDDAIETTATDVEVVEVVGTDTVAVSIEPLAIAPEVGAKRARRAPVKA